MGGSPSCELIISIQARVSVVQYKTYLLFRRQCLCYISPGIFTVSSGLETTRRSRSSRLGRVVWFGNCVPTSIICSLPNFRTSDRLQKSILKTVFLISKSQNQLKLNKQVLVGHIFKVRLFTYFLRGQLVAIMFLVLQTSVKFLILRCIY